jgi:U3 small nucleolar RNA-associated protein 19
VDAQLIENILQLLESITMPNLKSDIKSFYISELGKTPKDMPTPSQVDEDDEEEDDWRAYFDAKPDDNDDQKPVSEGRSSQFSTHKALHSLQSHKAQFSTAWLALLQHIKSSQQQSARVLSILHRSIMPYLAQPVQLMDWIGACVDFGK